MLILFLDFRAKPENKHPNFALSSKFSCIGRSSRNLISALLYLVIRRRETELLQGISLPYYLQENANPTKLRIKLQEQTLGCQLNFVARDFRDRATVLCMLTYPLILLSKPVNPNFQMQRYRNRAKIL